MPSKQCTIIISCLLSPMYVYIDLVFLMLTQNYGTYGLVCLYTSHICGLMPTHTAIFIVHVCVNALHIGTQCLYVKTKL